MLSQLSTLSTKRTFLIAFIIVGTILCMTFIIGSIETSTSSSVSKVKASSAKTTTSLPQLFTTNNICNDPLLSGMPCFDEDLPPKNPHSCTYVRIVSCFPEVLEKCLDNKLSPHKWIMVFGDSVSKMSFKTFTQNLKAISKNYFQALDMSPLRKYSFVPTMNHTNYEGLLFNKFLITFGFIGNSGSHLTLSNIRATLNLTVDEKRSIYELTKQNDNNNNNNNNNNNMNNDLPFGKPDIIIFNTGLWDARAGLQGDRNNMNKLRELFENEVGMDPDKLYWRSTTCVDPRVTKSQRKVNMTLERIQDLNSVSYQVLVKEGKWHYINGYGIPGPNPTSIAQGDATMNRDHFHLNIPTQINLMDVVFASICRQELSP